MSKANPEMTAQDVIAFIELLNRNHIEVHENGGWGVDALLGKQSRKHADLDIAIQHKDVAQIRALLTACGYTDMPRDDTREWNFGSGDAPGHQIDIHSCTFDVAGKCLRYCLSEGLANWQRHDHRIPRPVYCAGMGGQISHKVSVQR